MGVTVQFYIDDSGKSDPPVFVLGGWAIKADRLAEFENAWSGALRIPPAIPFFKMKEAHARRGPFYGISVDDRDEKVRRLGEVVLEFATAIISGVVQHESYRRVFQGQMMRWMDQPYQIMFHLMIANGFKLFKELGLREQAEFIFDRQVEHEKSLKESFEISKRDFQPELSNFLATDPRHADDKDEIALQAADMIAWHVRRSWRDGADGIKKASSAGALLTQIPGTHEVFDEPSLRYLASIATTTVRRMRTVFPYEAEHISENFDKAATVANFELIHSARPLNPVELISFPAIGTSRFQLVHSCAELDRPHLHRRSENSCLGEASAV